MAETTHCFCMIAAKALELRKPVQIRRGRATVTGEQLAKIGH
jgi:hypothetical protein